jgi:DNA repair exonuclease SbcCD ATPase subunit
VSKAEGIPPPVTVQRLELRRIAGVTPRTAFTLQDLPAGLVLIHGPNGCGKSTTASAIQSLLWPRPDTSGYLDLGATVQQDGETWDLEARGKKTAALKGADPVPHPAWAAPELRGRYHWSLLTLLEGQDGDLAAALAAEMAGGIDFQELSSRLGWSKEPSAPQKLSKDLLEAEKHLSAMRKEQEALRRESSELDSLREQCARAAMTTRRLPGISHALELQQKQTEVEELQRQLKRLPEGAERFQAGDARRAEALHEKLRTSREELRTLSLRREEQQSTTPLPGCDASVEDLNRLRRSLDMFQNEWRDLIRERQRSSEQAAAAHTRETRLRERLGITDPEAITLSQTDLPDLRSWAETMFAVYETEAAETAAREALMIDPSDDLPDAEELTEFLSALRKARAMSTRTYLLDQVPFLTALALLTAVILLLRDAQNPNWLPALIPASLIMLFVWRPLRMRLLLNHCRSLRPAVLQDAEVTPDTLLSLTRQAEQLHGESQRRAEWQELCDRKAELAQQLSSLEQILRETGLTPTPDREWIRAVLEDLQAWREAADEQAAAEAVLEEQEKGLDRRLESLRTVAQEAGRSLTEDDPLMDAAELRERVEQKLGQLQALETLALQENDLNLRIRDAEQDAAELAQRLGLTTADPDEVIRLQKLHAEWETLFRRSEVLTARVSELRNQLSDSDPELLELDEPSLRILKTESEAASETERDLRDRISRLQQRIDSAGSSRSLHDALEAVADHKQELEAERERQAAVLAGRAILDWLRESCRTEQQPEILREANRLLAKFTKGSLQLTLDLQEGGQTFRAARPGDEPRSLEDLSTGERTQVLMAARLAFLSRQERAPMPLLIDEALGTSDDDRATAIMQTLLDVVKDGRQVFYFTAQSDEVAKWQQVLDQQDAVPYTRIDLQALRAGTPPTPIQLPAELNRPPQEVKRRDGETDAAWAERLGVPAWTGHDPVEDLPLFLLLSGEEEVLTHCLQFGLTTWGPLQQLIRAGAAGELVSGDLAEKLEARTAALDALAAAWRIGRPPNVDPASVLESGIVTDAFADEVLRVLKECDYDAARFLKALETKAVQRWRQDNTEQLRALFYEQGTLTDDAPLDGEHLLSHARAALNSRDGIPGPLPPEEWPRLCRLLQTSAETPHS